MFDLSDLRRGSGFFSFSKIIFLNSVCSNKKDEVCHSFLLKLFTKSLHRGGVTPVLPYWVLECSHLENSIKSCYKNENVLATSELENEKPKITFVMSVLSPYNNCWLSFWISNFYISKTSWLKLKLLL